MNSILPDPGDYTNRDSLGFAPCWSFGLNNTLLNNLKTPLYHLPSWERSFLALTNHEFGWMESLSWVYNE
jgi:hypothetical protein